jgi:deoxycytidylate deaminase
MNVPASVAAVSAGSGAVANVAGSRIPAIEDRETEELIVAVVGPMGSGCSKVVETLQAMLCDEYGYTSSRYKLSELIRENAAMLGDKRTIAEQGAKRVEDLQNAGNMLRKTFGSDYLAAKSIEKIAQWRDSSAMEKSHGGESVPARRRHVHIIDSLKNPAELKVLRQTYGDIFWLIGVFAPTDVRRRRLTDQLGFKPTEIDDIIRNDYSEREDYGQSVRDTFFQADMFVRNDQQNDAKLRGNLARLIEILFGRPVHTPTQEETSMYSAYAEAMGSACLSRQVGATIVTAEGEIIGLGRNDVPRFKGGLYRSEHDENDHRCYKWGDKICHNDHEKQRLYSEIFQALYDKNLLATNVAQSEVVKAIASTDVRQLIEFSRAVHAEMEAIVSVARGNKAGLTGATMYCTTYPCHSCARHILASGIQRVVYIEPYPKSLATKLHNDAVSESENDLGIKLVFLQYNGVAPKHILKLFRMSSDRKTKEGRLASFDKRKARPISRISLDDYATHEKYVVTRLSENETKRRGDRQATLL